MKYTAICSYNISGNGKTACQILDLPFETKYYEIEANNICEAERKLLCIDEFNNLICKNPILRPKIILKCESGEEKIVDKGTQL